MLHRRFVARRSLDADDDEEGDHGRVDAAGIPHASRLPPPQASYTQTQIHRIIIRLVREVGGKLTFGNCHC